MSERSIHIARNGQRLGKVLIHEVGDLVDTKILRADDDYWEAGMGEWRPLNELPQIRYRGESPDAWKRDATTVMADAVNLLAKGTAKLAQNAKALAHSGHERTSEASDLLLSDYHPQIQKLAYRLVQAKPFLTASEAQHNEELMEKSFGLLYEQLPESVSRFIPEEEFIGYCLSRRHELLQMDPSITPPTSTAALARVRLSHFRLLVDNFKLMLEFYRDTLGLPVRFCEDGIYAEFDTGAAMLAIFHREFMAEAIHTTAPHDQALPLQKQVLILSVPEVDASYVALTQRGVVFSCLPTDRPTWGIRTAHLLDPEANLIEINSPLAGPGSNS